MVKHNQTLKDFKAGFAFGSLEKEIQINAKPIKIENLIAWDFFCEFDFIDIMVINSRKLLKRKNNVLKMFQIIDKKIISRL